MDMMAIIGAASAFSAAICIAIGGFASCVGEGYAAANGLSAMAQQPDEAGTISRTTFVCMAICETGAIYCFVVAMILIFANPFWTQAVSLAAK
ncbi:MAG: F0F1 ATP synthase subunit C [Alphaproteobacteria bacterium]|nr:F0F1 ATP synthase subunit C [Alphaproteobacteria bacterium]